MKYIVQKFLHILLIFYIIVQFFILNLSIFGVQFDFYQKEGSNFK
jgi:hypothetical protein